MKKIFTALAMAGSAPVAMTAAAPAVVAQDKATDGFEIPTPPEGKGQIIFYRTGGLSGAAIGCGVFEAEGTEKLSSLGSGRYFVLVSEPGERSFKAKSIESKDILTLEVEPDETQFVRCKIKMGFLSGRPNISPSSEKEFRKKYKNAKLVDSDDMSDDIRAMNYDDTTAEAP
ncbi:hypothetical protein QWY75_01740 [Pontixanthobacter aestiaquae]|uniref:DUF2846 domain-containing protein n=1 Tax=Pontixanthobacter aestiaquae TaxID=1509367 RepID=A0A844ZA51_9SPHN|nr:hypothetical protein [Pontixanthobacter aestiaquae]MDN3644923.1 hypothetical protein [Pontixanthobacter aestiaquae]MXO84076.1 hypothetical protein [Pontixanthobacter aestiaquae]